MTTKDSMPRRRLYRLETFLFYHSSIGIREQESENERKKQFLKIVYNAIDFDSGDPKQIQVQWYRCKRHINDGDDVAFWSDSRFTCVCLTHSKHSPLFTFIFVSLAVFFSQKNQ